jgi:hypothetical protein
VSKFKTKEAPEKENTKSNTAKSTKQQEVVSEQRLHNR